MPQLPRSRRGGLFSRPAALRAELERAFPERPFAMERAGLTVEHVEGFAADYARTVTVWLERFEQHFEEAVTLAGIERARIWRVYLHAARNGFESGFEGVYQVKCQRPV